MTVAIIQFGGSNCDNDVLHVLQDVLGIEAELVWYKEEKLDGYEAAVIPGGFSYGDYLRSGAIASRTPIMDAVRKLADDGKSVMGICNGFQILTESGLLDGALTTNSYPKFKCEWSYLRVENTNTPFTSKYDKGQIIRIPIAHKDGKYYHNDASLQQLEDNNQVVFRYVDENGNPTEAVNPNGSRNNIAGITNRTGNVLGMMPHPERASETIIGSDDGLLMFKSMVETGRK
ncbi:phosphoribosylformylglycinamidine synthase I [Methanohalophilus halophilus]|uniref:Phosphoribosylformylglycinamidine synthase subunit PurQ n=1 Tax=Methanohalophilus halophilus TaxID=2177 RepID=A0A1L3Q352_9EURY|nr:phosphoribosylformylglycinamidine synthase I [Methanohalophilus halophilus]APH39263.1 phosphoribosylformylglycinamidine synthase I [Methanohalophilus halophilus]RNI09674.1 phosphoribosylformylglycinamidine synthase I [Methanohalophilus halophilus]SDW52256.1 phosphoribosylformylglycinamidine synthase subunit I [Methanohalophilus halophilus]